MDFAQVPIEEVAAFWDARPCNIRHSPRQVGTREYFDEVEARKYRVEPHIPRFADFARWGSHTVLELGCGIGTDTVSFARCGARVTAVDISQRSLDLARRRVEVYGLAHRVRFVRADIEHLDAALAVEPYDLVYAFGVLHHTPRPERAVAQIGRYVRAGSTLKLMLYHRRSWKVLGILLRHPVGALLAPDALIARHSEAAAGSPVTYTYTPRDVRRLLSAFRIEDLFVDHIFPYRVADYVRHRYTRAWHARMMPAPLFRWLERRLGWHLCVTATAVCAPVDGPSAGIS